MDRSGPPSRDPVVGVVGVCLSHMVRLEERSPARTQVVPSGLEGGAEVGLGREVADGVVHEDRVERATRQAQGSHVAFDVLASRIDRAAQLEHLR